MHRQDPAPTMVSLDRFAVFRAVVEAGSFTAAATTLKARAASLQREAARSRARRHAAHADDRRVELTDAGERFYQRCLRVLEEAEGAIDEVRGEHGGRGILRVTSTSSMRRASSHRCCIVHARHPALRVRLETHTSQADLVRDRFDVAIRLGRHEHFSTCPIAVSASPPATCSP